MTEIVFGESAGGSLKAAMHFDQNAVGGAIGVIITHDDGRQATKKEVREARRQAALAIREQWQDGTKMDGQSQDVYAFPLALSIGEIADGPFAAARRQVLHRLYRPFTSAKEIADELIGQSQKSFADVLARFGNGQDVRIWYSDQPDEQCALCWLLAQLSAHSHCAKGRIWLVKLPGWQTAPDSQIVRHTSWGELTPGEWAAYLPLQQLAPAALCQAAAQYWQRLQRENAPLRALVNGILCSVPTHFYDVFIEQAIARQPAEFHQAQVIGQILGQYQLGITDAWLALRMEQMIAKGRLIPVTQPPDQGPAYHPILRKAGSFADGF